MEKHFNMPFALDYEAAVLGAVLIETKAMPIACKFLRAEMFYDERHRMIFTAIEKMFGEGQCIDIITVTNELLRRGELEKVGGPFFIAQLSNGVASSAHLEAHAQSLKDYFIRRELIKGLNRAMAMAVDMTVFTEDVVCSTQEMLDAINKDAAWVNTLRAMNQVMEETIRLAQQRREMSRNGITGIPTGFTDLDKITAGWQNSNLNMVAARPAVGKTMVAVHSAIAAAKAGFHVLFCSIEMPAEQLGDRCILLETEVQPNAWRNGSVSAKEWMEGETMAGELAELPIMIDDNPSMSMDYIRAEARLLKGKGKCDIVFIDYLQLSEMRSGDKSMRNREQEVAIATRKAKLMAKELDCPVVMLSQLNRDSENRPGKRPQLSDLRESGAIEQDADIVLLLYRPALAGIVTDKESGYPTEGLGMVIVAKHRNGETGTVHFAHNQSLTSISDYVPPTEWLLKQRTTAGQGK